MNTKVCVPIMGKNKEEVIEQAEKVLEMKPDMVEFRADYLEIMDKKMVVDIAGEVKKTLGNTTLAFTFRTKKEGGQCEIKQSNYKEICTLAASVCDYVDVEIIGHYEIAKDLVSGIQKEGAKVIGSNHHFHDTPDDEEIIEIMKNMEGAGADICKIAVMPKEKEDVERFIQISEKLKEIISTPIITMSMGELGAVTRVCTKQTGSCVTFAVGVSPSAPGQIDVHMARKLLEVNQGCILKGNIALIGFMGTGKTTVSKALSKITGFKEIDILKEKGVIVLLTATPETIFERVKDHTHRPILNSDMSLEYVKELMMQREPRYQKVADVKIGVDANDRILTCFHIITILEEMGYIVVD